MLETIRIQNFKSLRDVTLDLKQINLLIGPNNSGKSNFLKALEFLGDFYRNNIYEKYKNIDLNRFKNFSEEADEPISFYLKFKHGNKHFHLAFQFYERVKENNLFQYSFFVGTATDDIDLTFESIKDEVIKKLKRYTSFILYSSNGIKHEHFFKEIKEKNNIDVIKYPHQNVSFCIHGNKDTGVKKEGNFSSLLYMSVRDFIKLPENKEFAKFIKIIDDLFINIEIYKPDPNKVLQPYPITGDEFVFNDASNIVSFLDRMKDINTDIIDDINRSLKECIIEFKDIRLDTIKSSNSEYEELKKLYNRDTFKKLGVSNHKGHIFWADELSEGALYFIALLAIIHQPNPPKLLLLEEPEKGIHPRRIAEIIRYIQRLADEKNIQVIMTTHSPLVLDEFAHDPESIFVFDKENGETVVRNLQRDIIDKNNAVLKEKGISPIDYEENLSENWLMGLLNGVPND